MKSIEYPAVDPDAPYGPVFVFPIHKALGEDRGVYDATRREWMRHKLMDSGVLAIGLERGISRGVFRVESWETSETGKMVFVGQEKQLHELLHKDWSAVINAAKGFWQRGNYLIVEFDGDGKFKVLRGAAAKERELSLRED